MRSVLFVLVAVSLAVVTPALAYPIKVLSAKSRPAALHGLIKERATVKFVAPDSYLVGKMVASMDMVVQNNSDGAKLSISGRGPVYKAKVVGPGASNTVRGIRRVINAEKKFQTDGIKEVIRMQRAGGSFE